MASAAEGQHRPWSMKRVIAASSAGTAFEWYDFFIFGSLALTIQKVFFAGLNPTAGLIAALGLFAAGFAFRPLGAIIFGVIGDRLGRKGAFLATVSLMGGATFLIGLLPTYQTAGIIAPVLLIILRILQGIALGGEYGGAAIYVAEHSPNDRRGFTTGWIQVTASIGLVAGLLVILGTRTAVGEEAFLAWGWRVPFLISLCPVRRIGLAALQAVREPRLLKAEGCRRAESHTDTRGVRTLGQSKARPDRLLRDHAGAGRGLVPVLLLRAGIPDPLARRSRADEGCADTGSGGAQRAALRSFRLAFGPRRAASR
jgi:MFS family permease